MTSFNDGHCMAFWCSKASMACIVYITESCLQAAQCWQQCFNLLHSMDERGSWCCSDCPADPSFSCFPMSHAWLPAEPSSAAEYPHPPLFLSDSLPACAPERSHKSLANICLPTTLKQLLLQSTSGSVALAKYLWVSPPMQRGGEPTSLGIMTLTSGNRVRSDELYLR